MGTLKKQRIGITLLSALVLSPLLLFAADFRSGDQVTLTSEETITDDLYLAGGTVTSSGTVSGDLYTAGGTVLMNGEVSGDVVVGGGTVTLIGDIGDDLRAGGGTIIVESDIKSDAVIGGGQVTLSGEVGGDIAIGGGVVRIDGPVGGDAHIGGGEVYLNSEIAGNVIVDADRLTLGSNAVIGGNLSYRSPRQAMVASGAQILGEVSYKQTRRGADKAAIFGILTVAVLVRFLMILAGALVLGLFFKRYSKEAIRLSTESTLKEIGRGLLIIIILPVASLLLFVTVIGIPLGLLGLAGFVGSLLFAYLFAPVLLGSLLYRWVGKENGYRVDWKSILLGAIVFSVLGLIPFLGWLVQAVLMLTALGAAMRLKWQMAKEWR